MKKILLGLVLLCLGANADVTQNERVYAAANVVKSFGCDTNRTFQDKYLKHAKAVAILTDVTRTGVIASVQSGDGVFITRDFNGNWTSPLMIKYRGFGVGFQAGVESRDVIVLFQTSKSYRDIFEGMDTLEANAGASAFDGGYATGAMTDLPEVSAWMINHGEVTGLYVGATIDFGRLTIDNQATNDYYERIYDYEDILNGSPRDSKYTKMLKNSLSTYISGDRKDGQCNVDKFIYEEKGSIRP
ncbi:lipid-binding SYLF domain-containing protein [Campylobacter corcagiensis]|uniref:Lipid-binding SYLF domain-containing protein n=1 Tax=Campylobacter corcagiensis TaxID=1448857 RepID=A0A7M1LG22_9BACT|nr:lipid-binding SYLF domain-containing protein [Campylobacter corcagiensis]QKF64834.1 putative lipid-binding protein (SYLF/DUF500 domain) [Campylobacter corcagiensis]QOQ87004.1 lipid-binding SYLF domain-containing protein [Campylobacter corcagiensis]